MSIKLFLSELQHQSLPEAVADPEFPREGAANPGEVSANLLFGDFCPTSCMKMKKFWARGGAHPLPP